MNWIGLDDGWDQCQALKKREVCCFLLHIYSWSRLRDQASTFCNGHLNALDCMGSGSGLLPAPAQQATPQQETSPKQGAAQPFAKGAEARPVVSAMADGWRCPSKVKGMLPWVAVEQECWGPGPATTLLFCICGA